MKRLFAFLCLLVLFNVSSCNALPKKAFLPIAVGISKEVIKDVFDVDVDVVDTEIKAEKTVSLVELQKIFGKDVTRLTGEGGNQFWTKSILISLSWVYQPDTKDVIIKIVVKKFG